MRPRSVVIAVILLGSIGRIALAAWIGLGVDESYAVAVARPLSLSYFDHPPLLFWIVGTLTQLVGNTDAVLLRLPFILLFAGTTWMMYRLGVVLFTERAGMYAAVLLNISLVFSVSTGGWILPDGPLMFAMLAAVLCLAKILFRPDDGSGWKRWSLFGIAAGMAALSKYHAVFLALGALLLVATDRGARAWLSRPGPHAATGIAVAMSLPVFVWNAQHDWVSLRFQGGRAHAAGLHITSLAQNLAGQALYVLPWIWLGLVWQLARAVRAGPRDRERWFLACFALGPAVAFTVAALLGDRGLPHWPAPGYLFAFPLLGASIVQMEQRGRSAAARRLVLVVSGVFLLLVFVAASHIATGWMARVAPDAFRRGDPSLEAVDWSELNQQLTDRGLLANGDFLAATSWIDAAKAGYALAPRPVYCLGSDPRQFRYSASLNYVTGRDAVVLLRMRDADSSGAVPKSVARSFRSAERVAVLTIHRHGMDALRIAVFRGHSLLAVR